MKKIRIIARVGKRTTKKVLRGELSKGYRGQSIPNLVVKTGKFAVRNGPKAFVHRLKQEVIGIDRRLGNNLAFPNGLVTGVDPHAIDHWYKHDAKPVTIVIPSYNDLVVLEPCLKSLKETTNPKLAKIIVVDDYCQPEHREKLKALEDDQISVVFREKNGGFAKAVNSGLEAANPKWDVVLVNSDIVAHPKWLDALQYGAYEFGEDVGIVGPKLLYPDGRIQSAGSYRNTEATEWFDHYYRFQDENYGPANIPHYCLAVTGACMYVKRKVIDQIGILDDKFQFAKEDVDWCLRGWEANFRTLYFPSSTLTHVESATRDKNATISEKQKQSVKYFWEKWSDWFDKRNVRDADGRVKVIFVLQTLGISGGIRIVFEHAQRLADKNFNVEVWGLDAHDNAWDTSDNVKTRLFKDYDRMTDALKKEEAIKVATWWETAFPVWLASVKKGIPVYFIQEIESWFYPDDVVAQASVISCYRKEFRNMTTSQYNLKEIQELGLKATAIPCGYDDSVYKPLKKVEREKNVLLAVGRTFFQKNFNFTFKAWKALGEKRMPMWLFGIEPQMAKMDSKIKYLKKPSNDEVNKLYNQATAFVQTSRHEGFSLPPLEAMAAGCPVICTDSHGNRDFCIDGKNCIIVEQDNVEQLTAAYKKLFADKKLQEKLSKEGLKTAKRYRWEVVAEKVADFYNEVAK